MRCFATPYRYLYQSRSAQRTDSIGREREGDERMMGKGKRERQHIIVSFVSFGARNHETRNVPVNGIDYAVSVAIDLVK